MADPTRRGILARLAEGESTVKELAKPFGVSLPAISMGLKGADEWMDTCRAVWEGRARRLDAHLTEMLKGDTSE